MSIRLFLVLFWRIGECANGESRFGSGDFERLQQEVYGTIEVCTEQ